MIFLRSPFLITVSFLIPLYSDAQVNNKQLATNDVCKNEIIVFKNAYDSFEQHYDKIITSLSTKSRAKLDEAIVDSKKR